MPRVLRPGTSHCNRKSPIIAKLSNGEYVITAEDVRNFGGGDSAAGVDAIEQLLSNQRAENETLVAKYKGIVQQAIGAAGGVNVSRN